MRSRFLARLAAGASRARRGARPRERRGLVAAAGRSCSGGRCASSRGSASRRLPSRSARFDASRLELRALRAGAGDALAIDAIDVDYTLGESLARDAWTRCASRGSGSRVRSPRRGRASGGSRRSGPARPRAAGRPGPARGCGCRRCPRTSSVIEDARAEIATAQGPLSVVLSVNAQETEGRVRASADLVAHHALADAAAKLELAGEGDAITGGAALGLRIGAGSGPRAPALGRHGSRSRPRSRSRARRSSSRSRRGPSR